MGYVEENIEFLHSAGKVPDWAYYQLNGKSITENYIAQKQKRRESSRFHRDAGAAIESIMEKIVEELTASIVE